MPLIRDILVEAHGGVTNGVSVAFAHGEDLAEGELGCVVGALDVDRNINGRRFPVLIRHSDRESLLNAALGVEALHFRVGIVQGVDILSGSRIDVQRTVLAFHDRSLAVDGKVQVVQPFVILDDIVQVAFLRDGHVLHNVQDVLARNHFGAVVGAVDGDGNFLLNLFAVFITHVDDERIGKRLALRQMVGQRGRSLAGRVGVGAVAVLIEGQRDSAVLGLQRAGFVAVRVAEVVLERLGFSSRSKRAVLALETVDVMRLQGF